MNIYQPFFLSKKSLNLEVVGVRAYRRQFLLFTIDSWSHGEIFIKLYKNKKFPLKETMGKMSRQIIDIVKLQEKTKKLVNNQKIFHLIEATRLLNFYVTNY